MSRIRIGLGFFFGGGEEEGIDVLPETGGRYNRMVFRLK
jgi:hypothetical protein